jgi:hypothetical protein
MLPACLPCLLSFSPGGADRLEFFKNVVAVPNAQKTTLVWSFSAFGSSELWLALITFLYLGGWGRGGGWD